LRAEQDQIPGFLEKENEDIMGPTHHIPLFPGHMESRMFPLSSNPLCLWVNLNQQTMLLTGSMLLDSNRTNLRRLTSQILRKRVRMV
jgi:hypothetical protein